MRAGLIVPQFRRTLSHPLEPCSGSSVGRAIPESASAPAPAPEFVIPADERDKKYEVTLLNSLQRPRLFHQTLLWNHHLGI
jgi:hypothetical protein